ncbi:hypothetical protein MPNT_350013 [Candidatus Methylacidithermus pantelleriae]|uniref:Uncharacterized protein n=1 Tax=Candidatus Methylacidithermus pantelleriae TaxID=2744239 RepID=A0A8J2BKI6_9BACT|nr:hypothetical protein MPNT_350013 [Candidatus Methylacidithermus pantelleriae]
MANVSLLPGYDLSKPEQQKIFSLEVSNAFQSLNGSISDLINSLASLQNQVTNLQNQVTNLQNSVTGTTWIPNHKLGLVSGNPYLMTTTGTSTIYWSPFTGLEEILWVQSTNQFQAMAFGEISATLSSMGVTGDGVWRIGAYATSPGNIALTAIQDTSASKMLSNLTWVNGVWVFPSSGPPWYRFLGHIMVLGGVVTWGQVSTTDIRYGLADFWHPTAWGNTVNSGVHVKILINRYRADFMGQSGTTLDITDVFTGFGSIIIKPASNFNFMINRGCVDAVDTSGQMYFILIGG